MLSNLLNIPAALVRLVNIKEIGRFAFFCFPIATQGHRDYIANDKEPEVRRGLRCMRGLLSCCDFSYGGCETDELTQLLFRAAEM